MFKPLPAILASVRLLVTMATHVGLQVALPIERLPANAAVERFFPGVRAEVCPQVPGLVETPATHVTHVGTFARVRSLVLFQFLRSFEGLVAFVARKW